MKYLVNMIGVLAVVLGLVASATPAQAASTPPTPLVTVSVLTVQPQGAAKVLPKSTHCNKKTRWRTVVNSTGGKYIKTVRVYTHPTKVKGVPALEFCVVATTAKARKNDRLYITWDKPGKNTRVSTAGRKISSAVTLKEGQAGTALIDYLFTDSDGKRRAVYFPELPFLVAHS